uniref:THH1/TOM1/TOM3 domain-containing protein n=1 Tax=Helicotheca tamesis TaxID=374047 RepID=A0A7S2HB75_9STRA|mmetsp:Transcript_1678/g.2434  ORF Transcript_1678/g.2434 Transcript_1678/m.2434 type:complete len:356 (+) Transcript_1678:67-1134(+)|eukprot:CAMPEP_0185728928 /NCGR_PEP_ID=MMETSP1171-20130828/4347_1 /TAXON_ID=374046 /ORGANISM="Helicotheca tamensis, Strain CCMP826" /LENGTH=355 /DNA_ID=CAMNT_0028397683 /DNA_START=50 /DNA_END=1117 /DNA_ORIENTATION=+
MADWWEEETPEMVANRFLDEIAMDDRIEEETSDAAALGETTFEFVSDIILGLAFLVTTIVAVKRMAMSRSQGGPETTVVTAFYSLILLTSLLRTVWFLIPDSVLEVSYTPYAVMAFDENHSNWSGAFISEIILSAGSISLFSIFILILVYWADILKKYFYPGARRSKPMVTFIALVIFLVMVEVLNCVLFLARVYSSEGMILVNFVFLSTVSIVCVYEITVFSHRFRTVLKTLGAINQVSTESQVKRIVWITLTGNLFFFVRAFLESTSALVLIIFWAKEGTVAHVFSHSTWDTYIFLKHWSEVAILCLMLYILQSRFTTNGAQLAAGGAMQGERQGYDPVPDEGGAGPTKAVVV